MRVHAERTCVRVFLSNTSPSPVPDWLLRVMELLAYISQRQERTTVLVFLPADWQKLRSRIRDEWLLATPYPRELAVKDYWRTKYFLQPRIDI